ncbi:MAG: homocysteine S-methyltransferase family protein [Christensenellaceae bacterium]
MSGNLFTDDKYVVFDGGLGTMIQKTCDLKGKVPESLNFTDEKSIIAIHKQYVDAGADVIYTNTFGANGLKLKNCDYTVSEIVSKAVKCAREATRGTDVKVALSVGPLGGMLEPNGTLTLTEAYDCFKEIVLNGSGADFIVFETFSDLMELKTAILAAKENCDLPVFASMTFEANGRTFTGCPVDSFCQTVTGLGVSGVGINCGLGPEQIAPLAETLCKNVPEGTFVFIKANAGLPRPDGSGYDLDAEKFLSAIKEYTDLPVRGFGGCCGTTPEYIKLLKNYFADKKPNQNYGFAGYKACSGEKTVSFGNPTVCGERINPTGKKVFQKALSEGNKDYILAQAVEQADAGADILDVNVGLAGVDEAELLPFYVKEIQSITDLPLQIDTSDASALENALKCYNGIPVVNSVNGSRQSIETVLPLVKKYGAFIIGLTLDEKGIPETVEQRIAIARRIVSACEDYGIPREKIFIDSLTMTVSSAPNNALITLECVKKIKSELGVKTALGVSNVSFGLPVRTNINSTFLTLALTVGLDLAIINPNTEEMMSAVYSYMALTEKDEGFKRYIARYKDFKDNKNPVGENSEISLITAIYRGFKEKSKALTKELLKTLPPLEIVDNYLIKALDQVGNDYESGKLYLPELLQSAQSAQCAFEAIKDYFTKNDKDTIEKGKIVVATVKGDVHDIGKNIVKTVLENYGFTVYDLGKDVPCEKVIECVKANDVKLVGLSALMTTTLPAMKQTIAAIHERFSDVKVMVGGAVLTEAYAKEIGADYYSKDAKKSADIAKAFFGERQN